MRTEIAYNELERSADISAEELRQWGEFRFAFGYGARALMMAALGPGLCAEGALLQF